MTSADQIARHLVFDEIDSSKSPNLISYTLKDNANGDSWSTIKVIFNGAEKENTVVVPKGEWRVVASDGVIYPDSEQPVIKGGKTKVEPFSALILRR